MRTQGVHNSPLHPSPNRNLLGTFRDKWTPTKVERDYQPDMSVSLANKTTPYTNRRTLERRGIYPNTPTTQTKSLRLGNRVYATRHHALFVPRTSDLLSPTSYKQTPPDTHNPTQKTHNNPSQKTTHHDTDNKEDKNGWSLARILSFTSSRRRKTLPTL